MVRGVLHVESRPASSDVADSFHDWYEQVHIPEVLRVDGFVSARRFASDDGDTFIAIYELDVEPEEAKRNLAAARADGRTTPPPPSFGGATARYLRLRFEQRVHAPT